MDSNPMREKNIGPRVGSEISNTSLKTKILPSINKIWFEKLWFSGKKFDSKLAEEWAAIYTSNWTLRKWSPSVQTE